METKAKQLRERVSSLGNELDSARKDLEQYVKTCPHNFTPIKYDPIIYPAYHFAGDPPGTMGVDRQLPMDVPEKREDRWMRECLICGDVQYTQQFDKQYEKIPKF